MIIYVYYTRLVPVRFEHLRCILYVQLVLGHQINCNANLPISLIWRLYEGKQEDVILEYAHNDWRAFVLIKTWQ